MRMGPKPKPFIKRFRDSYTESDGCWLWRGRINGRTGYGEIRPDGSRKRIGAHRAAWEIHNGKTIPPGLVVRHSCDVRNCVNPSHLLIGTQQENLQDMVQRKRDNFPWGERQRLAKLTVDTVSEIRMAWRLGATQYGLARLFGVSSHLVSGIVQGKYWVSLEGGLVHG